MGRDDGGAAEYSILHHRRRVSRGAVRVAVDIVIFTLREGVLHVLLIRRGVPPFKGKWALPGGFVEEAESLDAAALRELEEETGVSDVYLEQLYSFGDPKRDPRGRVLSISYFALLSSERELRSGTDAADARWFPAYDAPRLAFDHRKILDYALVRLRRSGSSFCQRNLRSQSCSGSSKLCSADSSTNGTSVARFSSSRSFELWTSVGVPVSNGPRAFTCSRRRYSKSCAGAG